MDNLNKDFFYSYIKNFISVAESGHELNLKVSDKKHFIIPITYITPNHETLNIISLISALSNVDYHVTILLHDNNMLVHPRGRRELLSKSYVSLSKFIEKISDEIETILIIFKADMSNISILKASDLWIKIFQNQEFFEFYSLLGEIRLHANFFDKKFHSRAYHAIQIPFDLYVATNYARLYDISVDGPNFLISSLNRAYFYIHIRDRIASSPYSPSQGIRSITVCQMKPIPYVAYNDNLPTCDMSFNAVSDIIKNAKLDIRDRNKLMKNLLLSLHKFLQVVEIIPRTVSLRNGNTNSEIAYNLYLILNSTAEKMKMYPNYAKKSLLIDSMFRFKDLREVFSSKAMLKVIAYCNGELTTSDIAKITGLQLSNVSSYMAKLRSLGLVTFDKKPLLKPDSLIIDIKNISKLERDNDSGTGGQI